MKAWVEMESNFKLIITVVIQTTVEPPLSGLFRAGVNWPDKQDSG